MNTLESKLSRLLATLDSLRAKREAELKAREDEKLNNKRSRFWWLENETQKK